MTEQITIKDEARGAIKDWIRHILDRKGWTGTKLARTAKLAPSTVLRMYSDDEQSFIPTYTTIAKIADASGYKPTQVIMDAFGVGSGVMRGFASEDAGTENQDEVRRRAVALNGQRPGASAQPRYSSLGKVGPRIKGDALVDASPANVRPSDGRRQRLVAADVSVEGRGLRLEHVSNLPSSIRPLVEDRFVEVSSLQNDSHAFAFYMHDDSLAPLVPMGSTIIATRSKDPIRGDLALIRKEGGNSIVRIVDAIDEDGYTLKHPMSGKTITLSFESIEDAAVIKAMER